MNKIAVIYDDVFLKHETGSHPESPARLTHIVKVLRSAPFANLTDWFTPIPATEEELSLIH